MKPMKTHVGGVIPELDDPIYVFRISLLAFLSHRHLFNLLRNKTSGSWFLKKKKQPHAKIPSHR